jgi:hypothetical protein
LTKDEYVAAATTAFGPAMPAMGGPPLMEDEERRLELGEPDMEEEGARERQAVLRRAREALERVDGAPQEAAARVGAHALRLVAG